MWAVVAILTSRVMTPHSLKNKPGPQKDWRGPVTWSDGWKDKWKDGWEDGGGV